VHIDVATESAIVTKKEEGLLLEYKIAVPSQKRSLTIRYEKAFPHKIYSWQEDFVEWGKAVQTIAILDKTIVTDYWTKNKNEFIHLRDSLGLSRKNY
jgi:hypothetical protein